MSAAAKQSASTIAPPALPENRLKLVLSSAADIGNQFAAVTPQGTPFERVLEPDFWAHNAYRLRAGDEIAVHTDDMTYFGRLYVRAVNRPSGQRLANRATVDQLEHHKLGELPKDGRSKTHEVKFLGPHKKWCVIALADDSVVKEGCETSEEAYGYLRTQVAA